MPVAHRCDQDKASIGQSRALQGHSALWYNHCKNRGCESSVEGPYSLCNPSDPQVYIKDGIQCSAPGGPIRFRHRETHQFVQDDGWFWGRSAGGPHDCYAIRGRS